MTREVLALTSSAYFSMTRNSPKIAIYQILGSLALIVGIYLFIRQGFNLALAFFLALVITIWAKWLV